MLRRLSWLSRLALVGRLMGVLMVGLAVTMLPCAYLAHLDDGPDLSGHLMASLVSLMTGLMLFVATYRNSKGTHVGHREAFLIVGIGWVTVTIIGALPFYFYAHLSPDLICHIQAFGDARLPVGADFCSFGHSVFESTSGFTTTGATIITDGLWIEPGLTVNQREGLPRGILLWRSLTHFLGGMGIIVLGVAVLPLLGVGGMQLFKAEVPGPTTDKLVPRVGETSKLLWKVYLTISLGLLLFLLVGGMNTFEAICHTMSTMGTGGFSTRHESVGGFGNPYFEWVIAVFMVIAGTNFTLHFFALTGRFKRYWYDVEFRVYLGIVVVATALVSWSLVHSGLEPDIWVALRDAAFQVASIMTGTGFASTDFELWGHAPVALVVVVGLAFVGGMAGSTTGGVKVVRHILLVRIWLREIFLLSHPHAVRPIRLGKRLVSDDIIRSVIAFIGAYFATFVLGTLYFCLAGHDLVTAFSATASTLGNVGPGLGEVGPFDNYATLSSLSKWVCCILMILGRLELFTLLILVSPAFWRR